MTAEDRFYGATNSGGISRIYISNSIGGIEVEHLQYGLRSTVENVTTQLASTARHRSGRDNAPPQDLIQHLGRS